MALRLALCGFGLIGLAACSAARVPDPSATAGAAVWRHWQPHAAPSSTGRSKTPSPGPSSAAAAPEAVILALHGFNDYANAFADFAAYARQRGIAVHAYDQQGFGANPNRGLWPGTARLTADLKDAAARMRAIYGDTPLYVLGESMGGAVAILAATEGERPLDVDGLVLSAPAVWGGPHMNGFYRFTLWLASTLAPGWTLTGSGLDIRPSDNVEMLRALGADPLVIKATRTDTIAGLVALMDQALAAAPALDQRLLLLIGQRDEIVPPGALEDFRRRLETERAHAIRYPEGYHMLLRDRQRDRVFADIVAWIEHGSDQRPAGPS